MLYSFLIRISHFFLSFFLKMSKCVFILNEYMCISIVIYPCYIYIFKGFIIIILIVIVLFLLSKYVYFLNVYIPLFFSPCFFSPSLQLLSICSPFNLPILIYCLNFYTIHQCCTIWSCNNDGKPDDDDDDDDDYENNNLSAFQCDFDQLFF